MKTIKHCINPRIIDLCHRAIKLEILDMKIKAFLPEALRDICQAGSFDNGCLTLITSDAVWATPLNFLKGELRDYLRKEAGLTQLGSIIVKIMPLSNQNTSTTIKPSQTLPARAREAIMELADNCQIPALKQALHKLAK